MLQLFESFMKSAPQLVLQVYIMVQIRDWGPWTGLSAGASLISLAWAMAAYTHAMRQARPDKQKASIPGLALQAVWRTGLLAARITALVLFAICCQAWLFLLLGLHWLGMTVWVVLQKTDLCSTPWEECAYNGVVGVVYCFCFFNLREGRARGRMLAFYVVTVTQNLACLYLFLALAQHTHPVLATVAAGTVVGGTMIGLSAMLTYYRFFHPSGPITLFGPAVVPSGSHAQPKLNVEGSEVQTVVTIQSQAIVERSTNLQVPVVYSQTSHMPSDVEKSNSLRSLKHLWSVDRDGSLSSRSDEAPALGGSPQPDDGCTDRRMLLSSRASTRRPVSTDSIQIPSTIQAEQSKQSTFTVLSGPNGGLSQLSIGQSIGSNLTSRSTLNSQPPQSPTTNHEGWSSNSNQSVHSSNASHSSAVGLSNQSAPQSVRSAHAEETSLQATVVDIDDSKLSWNCTSMMEDTQQSEIIEIISSKAEIISTTGLNKRRGICSSVELGLDKLEQDEKDTQSTQPDSTPPKHEKIDDSFARLCHKLVANAEVKQLGSIELVKKEMERRLTNFPGKEEKRESDYIDSKQSGISSDGTPSEVLSAHDYENICAVNIAREAWGLRSWGGYSDIETWLHDDSVVRDRRRDTLVSMCTTTTASSEKSTTSESPPPVRQHWENCDTSAPPLPCRRPRPSYNRMDDYLDTLAYDLAEIEQREVGSNVVVNSQDNVFVAQPYVVDQHGVLYPLPASLDTILEELEESNVSAGTVTAADIGSTAPGWASSLVATIDEIRMGTCNPLDDTATVSESDFEVGSYRSLQLDATMTTTAPCQESPKGTHRGSQRFSNSLPSLLQAPRSWSHLTPEEVLFLSELKPQPESEGNTEPKCSPLRFNTETQGSQRKHGKRPRRKFSILREKFEPKWERVNVERVHNVQNKLEQSSNNIDRSFVAKRSDFVNKRKFIGLRNQNYSNDAIQIKSESPSTVSPLKEADLKNTVWPSTGKTLSLKSDTLLQQVLAQPKFVPHNKKLVLDSNASA
ncbi:uncharacterized protein LOC117643077 isoform X2 [Thrips palmi]|nr:uncharacterized protein LOC117643077 isoform X2 [Thrips palmi]